MGKGPVACPLAWGLGGPETVPTLSLPVASSGVPGAAIPLLPSGHWSLAARNPLPLLPAAALHCHVGIHLSPLSAPCFVGSAEA